MSEIVKKAIMQKIADGLAGTSLTSALRLTGGLIFTVKGLTCIFDSMQEGDLLEGLWGSLLTTGGVMLLTNGNLMVAVPTLIISIAAVSFAWLQTFSWK